MQLCATGNSAVCIFCLLSLSNVLSIRLGKAEVVISEVFVYLQIYYSFLRQELSTLLLYKHSLFGWTGIKCLPSSFKPGCCSAWNRYKKV